MAVHQAKKQGVEVRRSGIPFEQNGIPMSADIQVWPLTGGSGRECDFLVVLQETAAPQQADSKESPEKGGKAKERANRTGAAGPRTGFPS